MRLMLRLSPPIERAHVGLPVRLISSLTEKMTKLLPYREGCFLLALAGMMLALAGLSGAVPATAQTQAPPILLSADRMSYDPDRSLVQAEGNVEVSREDQLLKADSMTYDENRDLLSASGNVSLIEPDGHVIYASYMEITGDLKTGIIDDLRSVFQDGSRIAAAGGRRIDGTVTEMYKGVYSPCYLCAENPNNPPVWQVTAVKVRHDQEEKIIEFTGSWLEIDGTPVFYVPYFYQPDPTVDRKTGLLVPTFGASSDIGFFVQQPVYFVLSPQSDLTLTPWITTNEGPLLEGQYRQAFDQGNMRFDGSILRDSHQRVRGHIFGEARYDINDNWRAGLDVQRAQGKTYLRRYNFSDDSVLTSRLFAERFEQTNYFVGQAISFQGLRDDDNNNEVPVVAPKLDYYYVSGIDSLGGRTNIHFDTAAFTREDGGDNQRISTRADWELPFVGAVGDVFKVSAALWGDAYNSSNIRRSPDNDRYTGTSGRLFPQAGVEWRMPFVRDGESVQQIVEPIVEGIIAPNFGNPSSIPNEDSQDFEYDESNVFGFQRFAGLDRVEQGPRFNYGLNWSFFDNEEGRASFFAGQTYRFYKDHDFPNGSGLESNLSNVVTSIDISPQQYFDLTYRNRIDVSNGEVRRHELGSNIGTPALNTSVRYVFFDKQESDENSDDEGEDEEGIVTQDRQELDFAINAQLTRMWRARIRGIRDLEANSQRSIGLTLSYEDECLLFSVGYRRRNFDDRDLEASDAIFFRVTFKTIGGFGAGIQEQGLGS